MHCFKRIKALALLLALDVLISLVSAGCTDKDREMGPAPEPSADTIKYLFQQDAASKVDAEMTTVSVIAFDEDWNRLDGASMLHSSIADMPRDGGYIVAEARVPEETAALAYSFTGLDEDDGEIERDHRFGRRAVRLYYG